MSDQDLRPQKKGSSGYFLRRLAIAPSVLFIGPLRSPFREAKISRPPRLLRTRPLRSWPFTIASFLYHDYFWRRGIRLAQQNPTAQTWARCASTKGER